MKLTEQDLKALVAYFDTTNIDITRLIKKIGLENVKNFQEVIDKIYKEKSN